MENTNTKNTKEDIIDNIDIISPIKSTFNKAVPTKFLKSERINSYETTDQSNSIKRLSLQSNISGKEMKESLNLNLKTSMNDGQDGNGYEYLSLETINSNLCTEDGKNVIMSVKAKAGNERHKKTNSNMCLSLNNYRVDDSYYKKLLTIHPHPTHPVNVIKRESQKDIPKVITSSSTISAKATTMTNKKHFKKASCNNDFFFKITSMLNYDNKVHAKNSSIYCLNNNGTIKVKDEAITKKDLPAKQKSRSDNRLPEIKIEKLRIEDVLTEEIEEDELEHNKINNNNNIDSKANNNNINNTSNKNDMFAEITRNNNELKDLLNFSYNKLNESNITEENSMLNFSINIDQSQNHKHNNYGNCINFERNEDYLKNLLFR